MEWREDIRAEGEVDTDFVADNVLAVEREKERIAHDPWSQWTLVF